MKAKSILQLTYLDVILRTSGFAMVLGATIGVLVVGASFNWINLLAGFLVLVLMQGLAQHSLDTLMDTAPPEHSAFRKFAVKNFKPAELKKIYITASIASCIVVAVGVFLIKHYLIIPIFLIGLLFIYKYAQTNIEWYSAFAFAAASIGGFLTQADLNYVADVPQFLMWNMPICALFFFLYGFYKIGQVLYRTDDYQREMTPQGHIQYARWNLRFIHHQAQWPLLALIFAIVGLVKRTPLYSELSLVCVIILLIIWFNYRHHACNKITCKCNETRKARCRELKEKAMEGVRAKKDEEARLIKVLRNKMEEE